MVSIGGGSNSSKSKSSQSSQPISPKAMQRYWDRLDLNTGGRLNTFALGGTQPTAYAGPGERGVIDANAISAAPVAYEALGPEQVRALGGLGATRSARASRAYRTAIEEALADPSLTTFQRSRTRQNLTRDLVGEEDAIAAEAEAAITALLSQEAGRQLEAATGNATRSQEAAITAATQNQDYLADEARKAYEADLTAAGLTAKDLELLANIFYAAKAQKSAGSSKGNSSGWNASFSLGT